MKILNVVGARPNFVKIAPLIREMRKSPDIEPVLVHTGQHYDVEMSDNFFRDLDVPRPDFNLGVGTSGAASQTGEMMKKLETVLQQEAPDMVVVVGDVNSTLAGALTAVKLGIPVAHVEAGLRSFDRSMPEEINRVVTDAVSDLLFVTEPSGVDNLRREGVPADHVFLVGNVMIDTLKQCLPRAHCTTTLANLGLADSTGLSAPTPYAVLTLHRQGLVDNPELFSRVWNVLQEIGRRTPIIFPVHPRTQNRLREIGFEPSAGNGNGSSGLYMIPPLGYLEFLGLQKHAAFVLTDSGGIQEETTVLGVPCLTLRENTERPFTVTDGTNRIVGLDPKRIRGEVGRLLSGDVKPGRVPDLWDGRAAERIVRIISEHFQTRGEDYGRSKESVAPAWVSPVGTA